jgi:2-amino-4-hydroxy-6-hydroxymethyldihydropteridine diphosphokinase
METAYIGFGSNRGDREHYISCALQFLMSSPATQLCTLSSLYETEPVDGVGGPFFLNGVVKISTSLEPEDLLATLHSIESRLGRDTVHRHGPRTIDLDILLYGNRIIRTRNLIIPHPRMTHRSFVLFPLVEIEPTLVHPVEEKSVTELLSGLEGPPFIRICPSSGITENVEKESCV